MSLKMALWSPRSKPKLAVCSLILVLLGLLAMVIICGSLMWKLSDGKINEGCMHASYSIETVNISATECGGQREKLTFDLTTYCYLTEGAGLHYAHTLTKPFNTKKLVPQGRRYQTTELINFIETLIGKMFQKDSIRTTPPS